LIASKRDPGLQNEQAHELLTAGRELTFHYNVRDLDRAINCFQKALRLEPRSALAHAYLASAAASRTHYLADAKFLGLAEREVEEALRLAPDSGEVLRVVAGVKYQRGQFRKALQDGLRAMETGAPDGKSEAMVGMVYAQIGSPDQTLRWFELAKRFDSRPGEYDYDIGDCWAALGNDEKARAAYRRSIDLHPERSHGWISTARLDLLNGDFASARSLCRQLRSYDPNDPECARLTAQIEFFARNLGEAQRLYTALEQTDPDGGGSFYGGISYKSALGRLNNNYAKRSALLGECLAKELKQLEAAPDDAEILYRIAAIESSLGKTDAAIERLEAAVAAGWIDYRSLSLDPRFDAVAEDIRFQSLLGKLKLRVEDLSRATKTGL
jgi:tetratricopeptide (TPR) repeat protein